MDSRLIIYEILYLCLYVYSYVILIGLRLLEGISRRLDFWKAEEIHKFAYQFLVVHVSCQM